jgi:hypothetical protein
MKYTFHIVDVFSSTPFGGNQLAVLPDAAAISTEGMQKIAREFNFGETAFVLPKNDPNTYRVRIFSPRTELDFAGHPSVGTACALVMKQHVRLNDPIRLILEENVGPVIVDVSPRKGGFHGTLTLSGRIEAAMRCTATASKSRAASTAFKRSKKPVGGELRASWCRPSRPLLGCPKNTYRKDTRPWRDPRSVAETLTWLPFSRPLRHAAILNSYLGGRAARRFAGTLLRLLVTGFLVLAASNNCRMPCSNSPTAFSKAPSCPTRTIAMDGCRSNDGGRNTFTVSIE